MKIFSLGLALFLISGCSSYGVIDNKPQTASSAEQGYSFNTAGERGAGDVALILALSGGGTRAAALAYGVMPELRDTSLVIDGKPRRMLDEVDTISSVSGGSFTSGYYGLFGERIFEDFEEVFVGRVRPAGCRRAQPDRLIPLKRRELLIQDTRVDAILCTCSAHGFSRQWRPQKEYRFL